MLYGKRLPGVVVDEEDEVVVVVVVVDAVVVMFGGGGGGVGGTATSCLTFKDYRMIKNLNIKFEANI